jgi:acetyl esterase/lipase
VRDVTDHATLTVERDHVYRDTPERTLAMDVYRAPDAAQRPAVVLLHGGGWREGSKGQLSRYALDFAAAGYVTVEPNYRLSDEATFPAALEDVKAAVRHVRANAAELGADPDRVGVFGHSAGAHLAVLAGVTGDDPVLTESVEGEGEIEWDEDENVTARPDAVVGVSGVYDLTRDPGGESSDIAVAFFGGGFDEVPHRYEAASVHTHVDGDCPPTLFSHGAADEVVWVGESQRCFEILDDAGVDADRHIVNGGDHVFLHSSAWYPETLPRYRGFFDAKL